MSHPDMSCRRCDVSFNDTELNYIEVIEYDYGNEGDSVRFCGYNCMYRWFFY